MTDTDIMDPITFDRPRVHELVRMWRILEDGYLVGWVVCRPWAKPAERWMARTRDRVTVATGRTRRAAVERMLREDTGLC